MKIHRAYKIRLYPNQEQEILLIKTFGSCRFLWNKMLNERIRVFKELKSDKERLYDYNYTSEKMYKNEFKFLKEVDSKALQSSTRNLLKAFRNFFEGLKGNKNVGFPKYKSRKQNQRYTSYNINNNIKINFNQKRLKLPKIKTWIKFRDTRVFDEPIKHITVSKTKSGKYFASVVISRDLDILPKEITQEGKIEAYDMSLSKFLVSKEKSMINPRFYRNEEKCIKKLHKQLSKKTKNSTNRNKAKIKLARKYEKVFNRKLDWMHKTSTDLANRCEVIILENLNIRGMQQFSSGISKSVTLDFSWSHFISLLKYKMIERGNHLILVDRWFPSSKLCSQCGWLNSELVISTRKWTCPKCRIFHDRDVNASINIYTEGLKQLISQSVTSISTVGTTGSHACGDDRSLSFRKHSSMNQEFTSLKK